MHLGTFRVGKEFEQAITSTQYRYCKGFLEDVKSLRTWVLFEGILILFSFGDSMEAFKSFKYAQAPHFFRKIERIWRKEGVGMGGKIPLYHQMWDEEQGEAKMDPYLESWDNLLRELRQFA